MKKTIIIGAICVGATASALAQGTIIFENIFSTGSVTLNSTVGPYAISGTYTVALLWAPGNALGVAQSQFTQIALYGAATGGATSSGFFVDPNSVLTGAATPPGGIAVFEVEGWLGAYTSYAQAISHGVTSFGISAEFLNGTGNPTTSPPGNPVNTTGWDGNLILNNLDPEPSTLAIGGLGLGVIWYLKRRK